MRNWQPCLIYATEIQDLQWSVGTFWYHGTQSEKKLKPNKKYNKINVRAYVLRFSCLRRICCHKALFHLSQESTRKLAAIFSIQSQC